MKTILKKIKVSLSVGFVGLVLLLGCGCASIVNSNCYNVAVYSNTPTTCTVITKSTKETLFTGQTPCTVALSPSRKDCIFKVNGQEREVCSTFSPWFLGNIIFFYGAPIGMLIDLASGKVWVYPAEPLYFN